MLSLSEIRHNLSLAWRLFWGDGTAMADFDISFRAFWRSFLVIFLLLPIFLPYVLAERALMAAEVGEAGMPSSEAMLFWRSMALIVDLFAFPLLAALLARPLGYAARYGGFIIAYNWSAVLVAIPLALPAILFGADLIPAFLASVLMLVALVVVFRYRYIIARAALEQSGVVCAGLVAADFLMSITVSELMSRLAGF